MKFSEQWLREWVNPKITAQQLADELTMAGLEIESVTPVAGEFSKVVIGHVKKAEQHPDADRLRVCEVDIGESEPLSIVCGGVNVRAGLKVPVVVVGGKIKDLNIKAAKLRGVPSQGMICSTSELGLTETSEGIMELPADAPIGKDFREWMQLDDHIIDIHVTPNRGDCLSIAGIAREVGVLNNLPITAPEITAVAPQIDDQFPIKITAADACPRYVGRVIKNINANAVTPEWMIEKLRRSGIRNIHPVVDVTNYVLLELGQPLHGFDLNKLHGQIEVRYANADEKITLLDGQELSLDAKTLVITDAKNALAVAGIMGGLESGVTENTKDIFLESAFFNPLLIAGRARRYGLNTDSAYRFERGVDSQLQRQAIERATELLLQITGGQPGPVIEVVSEAHLPATKNITLRLDRIERVLGVKIPAPNIVRILQQLGMRVAEISGGFVVTPPSFRFDLELEADLIEEIIRIDGYQNVPMSRLENNLQFLPQSEKSLSLNRIRSFFVDRGYHEAITYSFIAPELQRLIDPEAHPLVLENPISNDLSIMRSSLWPSLLTAVSYNQNRQQPRVRLFETGLRFVKPAGEILQQPMLAGVIAGNVFSEQWGVQNKPVDFFDLKNDLEKLFALTGLQDFVFKKGEHAALHPGQCSEIFYAGKSIGFAGALHPKLSREFDLTSSVFLFELQLESIVTAHLPKTNAISKFPAIRRDISFLIAQDFSAQEIVDSVRNIAGSLLNEVNLFDVYQGKNIDAGLRSLALGLIWQDPARTLVDDEINQLMSKVVDELKQKFSIALRE